MGDVLEYITCKRCKKQQHKDEFWQGSAKQDNCRFCNKKTNIIPPKYEVTTEEALAYLKQIVFDNRNEVSMQLEMKMDKVFTFLERRISKEKETKEEWQK